jgi:hypothetical protein
VAATAAAQSSSLVTSWCTYRQRSGPRPVGDRPAAVVEHVADDHLRALGGEVPGVRFAHAARAAGDESNLAVETSHRGPPTKRLLGRVTPSARGDAVEKKAQQAVDDLVGAPGLAPALLPRGGDPQDVAQQPVDEPRVDFGAELAGLLAPLELLDQVCSISFIAVRR